MNTLLSTAITGAREAGQAVMELYATTNFETKTDGSPLTIADTRSNEILIGHLYPTGIPILSEESNGIPIPYPERLWIIDPLDGTKDFITKSGDFSIMIGLLENGRPTLGVVFAPANDTLYYAKMGTGAFVTRGGTTTPLSVSDRHTEHLRFVRSVNNYTPEMERVRALLQAEFCPRGSIGIKAGVIGEAQGEFFFSNGNFGEWDVCAPEIITLEAGGTVTDCLGNPLFYGTSDHRVEHGILFTNTACHANVLRAIRATPL